MKANLPGPLRLRSAQRSQSHRNIGLPETTDYLPGGAAWLASETKLFSEYGGRPEHCSARLYRLRGGRRVIRVNLVAQAGRNAII